MLRNLESAKSRACRACLFARFACLRAPACSRARRFCVLTCLGAWRAYVLASSRAWSARVFDVLACFARLRACFDEMFYFLTCLRAWRA